MGNQYPVCVSVCFSSLLVVLTSNSTPTDSCRFLGDQLRTVISVLDDVVYERNFPIFDLVPPCV